MASNDPSPEQIANLEKEQREAELQAEFDNFEREEQDRRRKQQEYDVQRAQMERDYAEQKRSEKSAPKTFTGVRAIDDYLDKSDIAAETRASGKRIRDERELRKQETTGQITPEYASFRRGKITEKYESQKVSDSRKIIGSVSGAVGGAVTGAGSYLDNGPARRGGSSRAVGRKPSIGKRPTQSKGFASGISGFQGVQFPSFGGQGNGTAAFTGFAFAIPRPRSSSPRRQSGGPAYSSGLALPAAKGPTSRAPAYSSGLSLPKPGKAGKAPSYSSGIALKKTGKRSFVESLNIGSPFGKKKTSPLPRRGLV